MLPRALVTILIIAITAESKRLVHHQKREATPDICQQSYDSKSSIQCFCIRNGKNSDSVISAECHAARADISETDPEWESFQGLRQANRVVFTSPRNAVLKYIPTKAILFLEDVHRLEIKYGKIRDIKAYAFGNIAVKEISLSNNGIRKLHVNSISGMEHLTTLNLDKNEISEINRNVFHNLPSLTKLYLTSNIITTIHDKAFASLTNLEELELDRNAIFSLNSETFFGLKKLNRLELNSNALEVIGEGTFGALLNLNFLHLDGNKIQMLDAGAFRGLPRLQHLSLALNKLSVLEEDSVFEGLVSLNFLSLRGNKIRNLKSTVMNPILENFYGVTNQFDFQDNEFDCDCGMDWFLSLKNHTENNALKLAIDNLSCRPDTQLGESWKKLSDINNNGDVFDESPIQNQTNDYEYYDESQLDGKLFYIDVRDLLHCNRYGDKNKEESIAISASSSSAQTLPEEPEQFPTKLNSPTTPELSPTTPRASTIPASSSTPYKPTKVVNRGVLKLNDDEPNTLILQNKIDNTQESTLNENKQFTTSKVVTVSAKPDKHHKMYEEREMSSDEALPDKLKAHRGLQEEATLEESANFKTSSANNNICSVLTLLYTLLIIGRFL